MLSLNIDFFLIQVIVEQYLFFHQKEFVYKKVTKQDNLPNLLAGE